MEYTIYQLKHDEDNDRRRFLSLHALGDSVQPSNYNGVYSGAVPEKLRALPEKEILERIYAMFNSSDQLRPNDYPRDAYSLSVSDVILLKTADSAMAYYVDSFGFVQLPTWKEPENYLRAAELSMEGNDNMIDGIINNLPPSGSEKAESSIRESVREHLNRERDSMREAVDIIHKQSRTKEPEHEEVPR